MGSIPLSLMIDLLFSESEKSINFFAAPFGSPLVIK
jgi:hypothetical protein